MAFSKSEYNIAFWRCCCIAARFGVVTGPLIKLQATTSATVDLNPNQIAPGKTTTTETDLNLFPCGRFGRAGYPAENTVSG